MDSSSMVETERLQESVLGEEMRPMCVGFAVGLFCFLVSLVSLALRRKETFLGHDVTESPASYKDMVLTRKLASLLQKLAVAAAIVTLPLLYVAAYNGNPAGNQDFSGRNPKRTWFFWYPRSLVALVSHLYLGPSVKTHVCLRFFYFVFLVGNVVCDSVSAVILRSREACIDTGRCQVPQGFSASGITMLIYRDTLAIGIQVWALLLLTFVVLGAGRFSLGDLSSSKHHDEDRARNELERCGFLDHDRSRRYRPFFGINGFKNAHTPTPAYNRIPLGSTHNLRRP